MILTVCWGFSLSEKGGSVMLRLDELSGEVAGLEMLRANLEMVQRLQKLEAEPDSWLRFQKLAELLEAPDCCTALQAAVRSGMSALVEKLRASFTADVASAAKDLGWPKVIEIPSSVQHATDGMVAEWIRPQSSGETASDIAKKPSQQDRLAHFCRALGC